MLSYLVNLSLGRLLPSRAFLRFGSRCKDTLFVVSMLIQFLMVFRQSHQPFLATLPEKSCICNESKKVVNHQNRQILYKIGGLWGGIDKSHGTSIVPTRWG